MSETKCGTTTLPDRGSPSPVKEVPYSLDRTPRDHRQALTCRLPNQNHSRAQRASSSMGPSKPVKGGDQTH